MSQTIIVTAFEPSGDAHAAPVIAALRARRPDLRIIGWGGPRMAETGAEMVQETVGDGAMGVQALGRLRFVRRERTRLRRWLRENHADLHLAVDSPAANFPLCRASRSAGLSIVHLVAPQLWAWGSWRAGRLRRTTDLVLCLLPFEATWFAQRRIPARFVGHPRIDRDPHTAITPCVAAVLPGGAPRLGLFPGSRMQEIRANLPLMIDVFRALARDRADLAGVIAASSDRIAGEIARMQRDGIIEMSDLPVITAASDAIAAWCDVALTVSGTMSLDLTRTGTPMVGVYRTSRFAVIASRLLLRTPWRLLPNVVAGREIVPEFVPCVNDAAPVAQRVGALLDDEALRGAQRTQLASVVKQFEGHHPDREAAEAIMEILDARKGR